MPLISESTDYNSSVVPLTRSYSQTPLLPCGFLNFIHPLSFSTPRQPAYFTMIFNIYKIFLCLSFLNSERILRIWEGYWKFGTASLEYQGDNQTNRKNDPWGNKKNQHNWEFLRLEGLFPSPCLLDEILLPLLYPAYTRFSWKY